MRVHSALYAPKDTRNVRRAATADGLIPPRARAMSATSSRFICCSGIAPAGVIARSGACLAGPALPSGGGGACRLGPSVATVSAETTVVSALPVPA
eukprot:712708-Amphidinium_carterae.1